MRTTLVAPVATAVCSAVLPRMSGSPASCVSALMISCSHVRLRVRVLQQGVWWMLWGAAGLWVWG